jgi:hypothetical protein
MATREGKDEDAVSDQTIYSGSKHVPEENFPEVVPEQDYPEVDERYKQDLVSGEYQLKTVSRQRCGLSIRTFWILVIVLALVIIGAVAGGVAGGVTSKNHKKSTR